LSNKVRTINGQDSFNQTPIAYEFKKGFILNNPYCIPSYLQVSAWWKLHTSKTTL